MPMIIFRPAIPSLAAVTLIATGTFCLAETVSFRAELSGAREVPPTQSKGTGSLKATLDTSSKTLTWTASYSGLSGPVTGAHFHGPASYVGMTSEQNAPIQVGTPSSLASPFKGSTTITDTQANDLIDGRWGNVIAVSGLVCRAAARPLARLELLLPISEDEWAAFLAAEVTPRFPDGLTVLKGYGQWRAAAGTLVKETSRLLLIWYAPVADADSRIEAIRAAYKARFGQDSVLRADGPAACVAF